MPPIAKPAPVMVVAADHALYVGGHARAHKPGRPVPLHPDHAAELIGQGVARAHAPAAPEAAPAAPESVPAAQDATSDAPAA